MDKDSSSLLKDKYLILGILFIVIEFLIFKTTDFILYDGLCLHHIPELFGCLFLGFWFARYFYWWVTPLVYILNLFLAEILFKPFITLNGMIASAIVSITLLIGDWTERYRKYCQKPS